MNCIFTYEKSPFRSTEHTFASVERPFNTTERTFGTTERRLLIGIKRFSFQTLENRQRLSYKKLKNNIIPNKILKNG